jgi:hypothetical protein
MQSPQPAPQAIIALAKRFVLAHGEALRFEVEYTANGETTLDEKGNVHVHLADDSEAARILRFSHAMETLAETGVADTEVLKTGIPLIGYEIHQTQETAQAALRDVMKIERKYRKRHHIPAEQELTQGQLEEVIHYRGIRQQEYIELQGDADKLICVQRDLLQILKGLGVTTRRPPGITGEEVGRS